MSGLQRPLRRKSWVDYLVQFRWIGVVFVILPISFIFHVAAYLQERLVGSSSFKDRQKKHEESVKKVMKRLKDRVPGKDGLVCTARKAYVSVGIRNVDYKKARRYEVDLSALRNILEIDEDRMIVRVEPLVTVGQITRATVPMNLSLPVVPELDDLTVGGLINGFGIEGSSHIYGLFSDTVLSYEIILSDGCLVNATAGNEYSDLFYAIPWSQGSLGLLVAAEINLVRVKEFIKLTFTPQRGTLRQLARSFADSFVERQGTSSKVPDFVETIIYSSTESTCMVGTFASSEEAHRKGSKINQIGRWYKPWFYQHAQAALSKGEFVEYIPTRDYYHRHTRSYFWEAKLLLPFGDERWFRLFFGWLMPPKISLLKILQVDALRNYYHDKHVVQDLLLPLYKLPDALEFVDREMEVYPIWLCPHKLYKFPVKTMVYPEANFEEHHRPGDTSNAQMYTDVGLYYTPNPVFRGEEFDGSKAVRKIEKWLIDNHGFQALYATTELNETDFWRMFDASLYNACRTKYKAAGNFMSVYYKSKKGRKTETEVLKEEMKLYDHDPTAQGFKATAVHENGHSLLEA